MTDPLFHEWRAYQKMLENDYMGHRKFFQRLSMQATRFDKPLAILDLGCGDATPMQSLLKKIQLRHYCGIDISQTALDYAGKMLVSCGYPHTLIAGDLLETARQVHDPFDLIIASFSLHHLQDPADKQALLSECRRILQAGGLMLIIDVFLDEEESRDSYLDRFEQQARENYSLLTEPEMTTLITHVRACDYPESVESYRRYAKQAGFNQLRCLLHDQYTRYQLISIESV